MSYDTAKNVIDYIFDHILDDTGIIEIGFIGGEPLLEFELIKKIFAYTSSKKTNVKYYFYATTNGTLLDKEMKQWFSEKKDFFYLGLSLDGTKKTHDFNRNNSFDSIDIDFFLKTWPDQGVKMTLSEYSLSNLANDIKFIHSLGFKEIGGVNLSEGSFEWEKDEYINILVPQLKELVDFYLAETDIQLDQMFDKDIALCESKSKERTKWCGIGEGTNFFDIDGQMYPCYYITPMTFSKDELDKMKKIDYKNYECFIDNYCFDNCYIYPICPTCSGANYMVNKSFSIRNKSKCKIQKLIVLFLADLQAKFIIKNKDKYDNNKLYYTIKAIKKIRELYLEEYKKYL
jgi:sulfatase maturation enzyme AslB (radical SAM superfamily)